MPKLTYDEMADEFARLTFEYLDKVREAPRGNPIVHEGFFTSDVLLRLWQEHRTTLLDAFKKGGWTKTEFDAVQRAWKESTSA